jgi:hypothetical protein
VNYEKRVWNACKALQIGATAEVRLGKKLQYYFFGHPFVNLVGFAWVLLCNSPSNIPSAFLCLAGPGLKQV